MAAAGESFRFCPTRDLRPRDVHLEASRQIKLAAGSRSKSGSTRTSQRTDAAKAKPDPETNVKDESGTGKPHVACANVPSESLERVDDATRVATQHNGVSHAVDDSNDLPGPHKSDGASHHRGGVRKECPKRTQPARKASASKSAARHTGKNGIIVNGLVTKPSANRKSTVSQSATEHHDGSVRRRRGSAAPSHILGAAIPVNVANSRSLPFVVLKQVPNDAESDDPNDPAQTDKSSKLCDLLGIKYPAWPESSWRDPSVSADDSEYTKADPDQSEGMEDTELGALLPKWAEMEMVLVADDSWRTDEGTDEGIISPRMPILSPILGGGEQTEPTEPIDEQGPIPLTRSWDANDQFSLEEPKWKRSRRDSCRPLFGGRKVRSWLTQRRRSKLSCPDIDFVDGMEFLSFDSEEGLERFVRNNPSGDSVESSTPPLAPSTMVSKLLAHLVPVDELGPKEAKLPCQPILPKKTSDITRIKGWRNKMFAAEALARCRLDPVVVRKLSWSQRMCLLSNFSHEELQERGLFELISMKGSQCSESEDDGDDDGGDHPSTSAAGIEKQDDGRPASASIPMEGLENELEQHPSISTAEAEPDAGQAAILMAPLQNEPVRPLSSTAGPVDDDGPLTIPDAGLEGDLGHSSNSAAGFDDVEVRKFTPSPVERAIEEIVDGDVHELSNHGSVLQTSEDAPAEPPFTPSLEANGHTPTRPTEISTAVGENAANENDGSLLVGFPKVDDEEDDLHDDFDRQSIESIDLGIFKSEPFDNEDFIEQPTADIPDPLLTVSPIPSVVVRDDIPNKSAFVSKYLDDFLRNQSELKASVTQSMEATVNPDEIQTKVVWPATEMPVSNEGPAPLYGDRLRVALGTVMSAPSTFSGQGPGRPRKKNTMGSVRGRYNKKFIMKGSGRKLWRPLLPKPPLQAVVAPPPAEPHRCSLQPVNGVHAVTMSCSYALSAAKALVRRSYTNDTNEAHYLDTAEEINESLNIPCFRRPHSEYIRKQKCDEFSVPMTVGDIRLAVEAVVQLARDDMSFRPSSTDSANSEIDFLMKNALLPPPPMPISVPNVIVAAPIGKPKCQEEFCQMGCLCDSLRVRKRRRGHCGKVGCMFGCSCGTGPIGTAVVTPIDTVDRSSKVDNPCLRVKRRREIKIPARLRDSNVYFFEEDMETVNLAKAVHARPSKKWLMSVIQQQEEPQQHQSSSAVSSTKSAKMNCTQRPVTVSSTYTKKAKMDCSPAAATAALTYLRKSKTNVSSRPPVASTPSVVVKNRPQMYPLAFRQSKITDDVRRDAILNIRPIKELSRIEAAAYGHLMQPTGLGLNRKPVVRDPKQKQPDNFRNCGGGFKPSLGIRPRVPSASNAPAPTFMDDRFREKPAVVMPVEVPTIPETPSVSAANRPKLMDLQQLKQVEPVVKPASSRSIPAILRRSSGSAGSSPLKGVPIGTAYSSTVQRALLQKLYLPPTQKDESSSSSSVCTPIHRTEYLTARKSLNPSVRQSIESTAVASLTPLDRAEIVIKNLVEEMIRKVAFRLEVGESCWPVPEDAGRRARISCFRPATSIVVQQQLPVRKKLEQHQLAVRKLGFGEHRASKALSRKKLGNSPQKQQKKQPQQQPSSTPAVVEDISDDDEVLCLGGVKRMPQTAAAAVAKRGVATSGGPSGVDKVPQAAKQSKEQREQQRRNAILMAFTNLAMVSSPVVKDIWTKKDDSVPITAFVFKMASAAILRLQYQERQLVVLKQAMIRHRTTLFNKYSENLKELDSEKQKLFLRNLSVKMSACCSNRLRSPASTGKLLTAGPSVLASTTVPAAAAASAASLSRPLTAVTQKGAMPRAVGADGKAHLDDDVMEIMPMAHPTKPAAETAAGNTRFVEGDAIGKVGNTRIVIGEPVFIGGIGARKSDAAGSVVGDQDGSSQDPNAIRTIRLQRPFGVTEWIPLRSSREVDGSSVRDAKCDSIPKFVKVHLPSVPRPTALCPVPGRPSTMPGNTYVGCRASQPLTAFGIRPTATVVPNNPTHTGTRPMYGVCRFANPGPRSAPPGVISRMVLNHHMTRCTMVANSESNTGLSAIVTQAPVLYARNFRPTIVGSMAARTSSTSAITMTTSATTAIQTDGGVVTPTTNYVSAATKIPVICASAAGQNVPLMGPFFKSFASAVRGGCPVSGATLVIGVIPKTVASSSSNGTVTTTGSTMSTGVVMSPQVNFSLAAATKIGQVTPRLPHPHHLQQQQHVLTIPIPPGAKSFTLDGKNVLIMKSASHIAAPLIPSKEPTKKDDVELADPSLPPAVQQKCIVQTVSLLVGQTTQLAGNGSSTDANQQQQKILTVLPVRTSGCTCSVASATTTIAVNRLPSQSPTFHLVGNFPEVSKVTVKPPSPPPPLRIPDAPSTQPPADETIVAPAAVVDAVTTQTGTSGDQVTLVKEDVVIVCSESDSICPTSPK